MAEAVNYYAHHIGDYAKDTAHLSMLEDAAYRRMLDVAYATEKPLPKDLPKIYRLVRARTHAEQLAVGIILGEFWTEGDDGWHNKRVDEELAKAHAKSDAARASAAKRWHSGGNANAMRTHSEGNAPNNQERKEAAPDGALDGVFGPGLQILLDSKIPEHNARSFLGALLSTWEPGHVLEALQAASGKADPRSYVRGVLKSVPKKGEQPVRKVAMP